METITPAKHFTEMRVWQAGHLHVLSIYRTTKVFPKDEMFGLTSQMRRAAVSVCSNIAEGFGRPSKQEKIRFYTISYGSALELESQLMISRDLGYIAVDEAVKLLAECSSLQRQINGLIRAISASK